jgi:hypothetical protein
MLRRADKACQVGPRFNRGGANVTEAAEVRAAESWQPLPALFGCQENQRYEVSKYMNTIY